MPGLLVLGERGLAGEHLVEEEFVRPGGVLVDLEFLDAGLLLRLRQELLQQPGYRGLLAGIDLPKRRDDEILVCTVCIHGSLLLWPVDATGDGAVMPVRPASMFR